MNIDLIVGKYTPDSKSFQSRMGYMDLMSGSYYTIKFLEPRISIKSGRRRLSGDQRSIYQASVDFFSNNPIHVWEAGTYYRFLQYFDWKTDGKRKFVKTGTLADRKISNDSNIVNMSLKELLELDSFTSQWASAALMYAAVLDEDSPLLKEKVKNPPEKIRLTYEAIDYWISRREKGLHWENRLDPVIFAHQKAITEIKYLGQTSWKPNERDSEDACMAYALDMITMDEMESRYRSTHGHETPRPAEMKKWIPIADAGKPVYSKDHRPIHAMVARLLRDGKNVDEIRKIMVHAESVDKSSPGFWDLLQYISQN